MVWISGVPDQNGVSLLYIMLDRVADHVQMGVNHIMKTEIA